MRKVQHEKSDKSKIWKKVHMIWITQINKGPSVDGTLYTGYYTAIYSTDI